MNQLQNDQSSTRFASVRVSTSQLAAAALQFETLAYSSQTRVWHNDSGQWQGMANCFGILLLAAREVALLPQDFDLNLSPTRFNGQRPAKTLWQILHHNFDEVEWKDAEGKSLLQRADVLLFRWLDVDQRLNEPHHVALHLGTRPHEPYGRMLHALEGRSGGQDSIFQQRLSELDWRRIDRAFRLKGIVDE